MKSDRKSYLPSEEEQHAASDSAPDIEGAMLGILMNEAQHAATLIRKLPAFYFSEPSHKETHHAIQSLVVSDVYPDPLLVIQWLKEQGKLERAGGMAYISSLADTASKTQYAFEHYLEKLKEKANCRRLKSVTVVLENLTSKGSLSSAHLQDARDHISFLLDKADLNGSVLPEIEDSFEKLASPPLKPPELIAGLLHQGTKLVFGGSSKSFKTWTQMDMAVSVACGVPFWGFETIRGRVLYVNFEVQSPFFYERLKMVLRARGLEMPAGALDHWGLIEWCGDVNDIIHQFIQRTHFQQYRLIIIDPTYKLLGGRDENAASDIGTLMNAFGSIAIKTGAAVAFGSHFSKGNQAAKEAIDRISGSGVFARDPDSIITMTAHQEENTFSVEVKLRNLSPINPFCVRWKCPLMIRDGTVDPAKLRQPGGRPSEYAKEDLLSVLNQSMTTTEWSQAASDEHGVSRAAFYRLLKQLVRDKAVLKSAVNQKWARITNSQNNNEVSKVS